MRNITVYLASFLFSHDFLAWKNRSDSKCLLWGALKALDVKKYNKNVIKTKKCHANFDHYCYEICSKAQQLGYGR